LDDFGIGPTLKRFLNFLEKQGAEVVVTSNADDKYLEAKTASLVAKRTREAVMKAINENPEFRIDGLSVGSGNAGDPQTVKWLEKWRASGKPWPWFVKRSFRTVRGMEGKLREPEKIVPSIREDILSKEFLEDFNRGHLSIQSLSLVCSSCGAILKSATFATFDRGKHKISELKCPSCNNFIKNAGFTLRYYCGYVVPDSSVIQRNLISNDLDASRFFEDFTVILAPVVRKECDGTPRGKREFGELWKYDAMGRIRLESLGKIEEVPEDLPKKIRDEKIIETCLNYNAILLTADTSMSAFAGGKNVFTIFI
jgi:ribonuclease HII